MEKVIELNAVAQSFAGEISEIPGGEGVSMCFHCGTCTAGCPIREIDDAYNPRNILRMIVLGMRDELLSSNLIWLCSTCFSCHERCPQNVGLTEIITALRNLAVKNGRIHPTFKIQAELLGRFGRLYEVEDFDNKKRKKLGLPPVQKISPEVKEIFKMCGLDEYVKDQV